MDSSSFKMLCGRALHLHWARERVRRGREQPVAADAWVVAEEVHPRERLHVPVGIVLRHLPPYRIACVVVPQQVWARAGGVPVSQGRVPLDAQDGASCQEAAVEAGVEGGEGAGGHAEQRLDGGARVGLRKRWWRHDEGMMER